MTAETEVVVVEWVAAPLRRGGSRAARPTRHSPRIAAPPLTPGWQQRRRGHPTPPPPPGPAPRGRARTQTAARQRVTAWAVQGTAGPTRRRRARKPPRQRAAAWQQRLLAHRATAAARPTCHCPAAATQPHRGQTATQGGRERRRWCRCHPPPRQQAARAASWVVCDPRRRWRHRQRLQLVQQACPARALRAAGRWRLRVAVALQRWAAGRRRGRWHNGRPRQPRRWRRAARTPPPSARQTARLAAQTAQRSAAGTTLRPTRSRRWRPWRHPAPRRRLQAARHPRRPARSAAARPSLRPPPLGTRHRDRKSVV